MRLINDDVCVPGRKHAPNKQYAPNNQSSRYLGTYASKIFEGLGMRVRVGYLGKTADLFFLPVIRKPNLSAVVVHKWLQEVHH